MTYFVVVQENPATIILSILRVVMDYGSSALFTIQLNTYMFLAQRYKIKARLFFSLTF